LAALKSHGQLMSEVNNEPEFLTAAKTAAFIAALNYSIKQKYT
jgi:hypothetical protein